MYKRVEVVKHPDDEQSIYFAGELQIDLVRGVLYFHDAETGISRLRICKLNPESLQRCSYSKTFSIDITSQQGSAMYCE